MMDYTSIKEQFQKGEIKQQHLEYEVFRQLFRKNRENVAEACTIAAKIRCEVLEENTGKQLDIIKRSEINTSALLDDNTILPGIEMRIGAALIPMGVAGPMKVNGQYANGEYYIPLATNEVALIAGVQRGIKAINMAGGVNTLVRYDEMARAPMLQAPDIYEAAQFIKRVEHEQTELVRDFNRYVKDPFVRLEAIDPYQIGVKVILRLRYITGDAMGMNGATKASADIIRALLRQLSGWRLITISSNVCSDKKAAHINVLNGRGKSVETQVFVPEEILATVFKKGVTSRSVEKVVYHKCYLGSCFSGTISGFNVNAANTIAAIFAATGQDLAQVITSAACFIQAEAMNEGLLFTASLPSLEVGTIGGGSLFGTAREALDLIDCAGFGESLEEDNIHVKRFAELVGAAVTALDLNTACAQAAGYEMADSHVRLARGEKE
jgi:hydroxymethylglutaryl-CoA reductase (NADPH)